MFVFFLINKPIFIRFFCSTPASGMNATHFCLQGMKVDFYFSLCVRSVKLSHVAIGELHAWKHLVGLLTGSQNLLTLPPRNQINENGSNVFLLPLLLLSCYALQNKKPPLLFTILNFLKAYLVFSLYIC